MPKLVRTVAISLTLFGLSPAVMAQVTGLPDWPKPPTTEDCKSFQAAITAFHREADEQYRACSTGKVECGDAPARSGAASVKKSEIGTCFLHATKSEAWNHKFSIVKAASRDEGLKAAITLGQKIEYRKNQIDEIISLRNRFSNISNLSDSERIGAFGDYSKLINRYASKHDLSRIVTDISITEISRIQGDALTLLDRNLKQITENHRALVEQQAKNASLRQIEREQNARSANSSEIINRNRKNMANLQAMRAAAHWDAIRQAQERQRVHEAREREALEARRRQDTDRQDQEAAAALNSLLSGLAGAVGSAGRSYSNPTPSRHYNAPTPAPARSAPISGGTSRWPCGRPRPPSSGGGSPGCD